jgi:hypothetical protein
MADAPRPARAPALIAAVWLWGAWLAVCVLLGVIVRLDAWSNGHLLSVSTYSRLFGLHGSAGWMACYPAWLFLLWYLTDRQASDRPWRVAAAVSLAAGTCCMGATIYLQAASSPSERVGLVLSSLPMFVIGGFVAARAVLDRPAAHAWQRWAQWVPLLVASAALCTTSVAVLVTGHAQGVARLAIEALLLASLVPLLDRKSFEARHGRGALGVLLLTSIPHLVGAGTGLSFVVFLLRAPAAIGWLYACVRSPRTGRPPWLASMTVLAAACSSEAIVLRSFVDTVDTGVPLSDTLLFTGATHLEYLGGLAALLALFAARSRPRDAARIRWQATTAFMLVFVGIQGMCGALIVLGARGAPVRYAMHLPMFTPLHRFATACACCLAVGLALWVLACRGRHSQGAPSAEPRTDSSRA